MYNNVQYIISGTDFQNLTYTKVIIEILDNKQKNDIVFFGRRITYIITHTKKNCHFFLGGTSDDNLGVAMLEQ